MVTGFHASQTGHPQLRELAARANCRIEVVIELYQHELHFLERNSRIHSYIPVLAMKRVRDALRGNARSARHQLQRLAAAS